MAKVQATLRSLWWIWYLTQLAFLTIPDQAQELYWSAAFGLVLPIGLNVNDKNWRLWPYLGLWWLITILGLPVIDARTAEFRLLLFFPPVLLFFLGLTIFILPWVGLVGVMLVSLLQTHGETPVIRGLQTGVLQVLSGLSLASLLWVDAPFQVAGPWQIGLHASWTAVALWQRNRLANMKLVGLWFLLAAVALILTAATIELFPRLLYWLIGLACGGLVHWLLQGHRPNPTGAA